MSKKQKNQPQHSPRLSPEPPTELPRAPKSSPGSPDAPPGSPGAPSGARRPPERAGRRSNRPYPAYLPHYFNNHHRPDSAPRVTMWATVGFQPSRPPCPFTVPLHLCSLHRSPSASPRAGPWGRRSFGLGLGLGPGRGYGGLTPAVLGRFSWGLSVKPQPRERP